MRETVFVKLWRQEQSLTSTLQAILSVTSTFCFCLHISKEIIYSGTIQVGKNPFFSFILYCWVLTMSISAEYCLTGWGAAGEVWTDIFVGCQHCVGSCHHQNTPQQMCSRRDLPLTRDQMRGSSLEHLRIHSETFQIIDWKCRL